MKIYTMEDEFGRRMTDVISSPTPEGMDKAIKESRTSWSSLALMFSCGYKVVEVGSDEEPDTEVYEAEE